ncbi:hypothetical protein UFOVP48_71 [uncultured Caudovirales phage]|uniref:Uncharacterized protein n=1 Tax=uncultured Caudovirales phage TaxID=2100421 RepID=A0A6J5KU61_9CAUD|nr:hypothetical protein UFOVP48_71 [uncultured Caudovirales phage]
MTYTELCTNIADICENTFTVAEYAMFTQQAEQHIYNSVQLANLRKNVTGTVTANNKYLSCPSDFLSTYSIAIIDGSGNYTFLLNKDVNFIREAYPSASATGLPKHYAIFGPQAAAMTELSYILGPTPDAMYSVELHYYYYPESIVTAGSTWLGDNFDSALLNGALVEAIRFMKGEQDMVALYQSMYTQAILLLKNLGDGKQRMDAYRDGQVRTSVA